MSEGVGTVSAFVILKEVVEAFFLLPLLCVSLGEGGFFLFLRHLSVRGITGSLICSGLYDG